MPCVQCPECGGQVSGKALGCPHCGYFEVPRAAGPRTGPALHRAGGYLLEAATLLFLFRMTMPIEARPSWAESGALFIALVGAGLALHHKGERAGRRAPAAAWTGGR
jgi:hypothetical protein